MSWETIIFALLPIIGGIAGWYFRARWESALRYQEKLRAERAGAYMDILDPFIKLFADMSPEGQKKTLKTLKSLESKRSAFRLVLVGEDAVVQAWNRMWKTIYVEEAGSDENIEILRSFGVVLLEIRKSISSKNTSLREPEMLQWLIKDIESLYSE